MTFSFEVKADEHGAVSINGLKYPKATALKIAQDMLAAIENDSMKANSLPWMQHGTLDEFQKPWRPLAV